VEDRQATTPATAPVGRAAPPDAAIIMRSWTIDLAAERDVTEVVALALFVPPMLGWLWLFNLAGRYWSTGR
jgi:hypothetical protein